MHGASLRRRRSGWPPEARIARFNEPGLLLLLRERPSHGYELIDSLAELIPERRVDMGNLYRTLRALETRGLVDSEWDAEAPGPAKRRYELTDAGRKALDEWAANLEQVRDRINEFLRRYERKGDEHVQVAS
jgi:PadR family transcriptional regulator, regulatory protein PadR